MGCKLYQHVAEELPHLGPLGWRKAVALAEVIVGTINQSGGFQFFEVLRNVAMGKQQPSSQLAYSAADAGAHPFRLRVVGGAYLLTLPTRRQPTFGRG